jgi:glycosyltransferase involved in cell wall biosynthesis
MANKTVSVCVFNTKHPINIDKTKLDYHFFTNDDNLDNILTTIKPQVIITIGEPQNYPNLSKASYHIRKKWINLENTKNIDKYAMRCFIKNLNRKTPVPLVSIFTAAYNSKNKIQKPYNSLISQNYTNWEWVILDDSDNNETLKIPNDYRIRIYKNEHIGRIGAVKHDACMLCQGDILVELDHDDELTPDALNHIINGFNKYPEGGFLYSNFADFDEYNNPLKFPSPWGFHYGSYKTKKINNNLTHIAYAPNINSKTIRHIISAPNHVRAWRKTTYHEIGGHDRELHVVDDYELIIRTFLHTRMIKTPKLCYKQYYYKNNGNTQKAWNKEIQKLVKHISNHYEERIHKRLIELNVDDFIWKNGKLDWSIPNPKIESHCTLIV